jgi:hypothetical protein
MPKYIDIELVFMVDHSCEAWSRHLETTGNKSFSLALNRMCKAMIFSTHYMVWCIRLATSIHIYGEPAQGVNNISLVSVYSTRVYYILEILKLIILQFSAGSSRIICVLSKYSPQHPVLIYT